ncbi:uncharacterized protein LOC126890284 [Diabrotica virgifera virgifera]|uniref:Endonuclease/exonuclease/phosphatase domain-containing protein n=1 Tax=Diabrotica virgifera virgifera TaxID=50390 RepID=A0ABM5KY30_DIAVI|nr:uncharacterized protein LOC126890284 [Diabrotica virgifera virgifera]
MEAQKFNIEVYYQNCRSLLGRTQLVYTNHGSVPGTHKIFAFTETWLNSSVYDSELFDPELFTVIRSDRDFLATGTTRGGGVLLAVNKALNVIPIDVYSICAAIAEVKLIDVVISKVVSKKIVFYLVLVYIPPQTPLAELELFLECLETVECLFNETVLVLGDFNIPEYTQGITTGKSVAVQNVANFFNLSQYNHVVNHNERILDLVFSNIFCNVYQAIDYVVPMDNHHPPLIIDFSIKKEFNEIKIDSKQNFNFKRANFIELYNELYLSDWSFLSTDLDINSNLNAFYQYIHSIFSKHIPLKKKQTKRYPFWFNGDLINLLNTKNRAWNAYKKSRNIQNYTEFKRIRSEFKYFNQIIYKRYVSQLELNLKQDPRSFWSFINSKKTNCSIPETMSYNNIKLETSQDIASSFADFFSKSYTDISPPDHITPKLNTYIAEQLHIPAFTKSEIEQIDGNIHKLEVLNQPLFLSYPEYLKVQL